MIIAAKVVNKPRVLRRCTNCGGFIVGRQLRLYGYAEVGDKPYVIYEHTDDCLDVGGKRDPKIIDALREVK